MKSVQAIFKILKNGSRFQNVFAKGSLEDGDAETISAKTQTLIQASMKLGEAMYKAQQGDAEGDSEAQPESSSDDVVDAEFEEVDGSPGGDDKKSA